MRQSFNNPTEDVMPATNQDKKVTRALRIATVVGAGLAAYILTACDGGGGGVPKNSSTVMGTVESFDGGARFFLPHPAGRGLAALASDLSRLIVLPAEAAVQGCQVSVAGQSATTAEDGLFVISGVPPGTQLVTFTFAGQSAAMPVDVPAHATVDLKGVRVSGEKVDVDNVDVQVDDSVDQNDDPNDDSVEGADDDTDQDGVSEDGISENGGEGDGQPGAGDDGEEVDDQNGSGDNKGSEHQGGGHGESQDD